MADRRRGLGAGALAAAVVATLVGCTPMADAARDATAKVEQVVGDSGKVSASTRERGINVTASCSITVRLGIGTSAAETSVVLEDVWAAPGDSPCVVTTVELANRSSMLGSPAVAMPSQAAAAASDVLQRFGFVITLGVSDGDVSATSSARTGDFSTAAQLVREASTSTELDDPFGRVFWSLRWTGEGAPYDDVTVTSDSAPPAALVDLLTGLGDLRASGTLGEPTSAADAELDSPIIGMSVTSVTEAGSTALSVDLTVEGWDAAELAARGDDLSSSSRAADAARSITAIAASAGMSIDSITANQAVELLAAG
ncbi:hypothetical protein MN032_11910 [Agromyces atrinae]|uniref:hypothetical protein n=1 Tax=Agromyces atrinae TaxID=592376 RepID=UPI001F57ED9A|nr:hypothetical protein [Agromyces atrinae]MCI2958399.1 hypothetical protein [Agromyces atrinae]